MGDTIMPSTINASTTGGGGVITTADASGVLNLQSNGVTMASISPSGFNLGSDTPSNATALSPYTGFKNRIINGAMMVDQRNAGASVTPTNGQYTLDRWGAYAFGSATSKFTVQQSSTAPTGFKNSLQVTSTSAYSVASGDITAVYQIIEGYNVADLGFGAAGAATITISFWVRSSLTGTFGGAIKNGGSNRAYPFSYTISSANTWEQKSVTIAGDTTGTWLTTNGQGLFVMFGLGVGSTYSGTAGAWASSDLYSVTGATSVVGTNGATWFVTGVQLEKGSTATSFEYRPYGTELVLCQRYYAKVFSSIRATAVTTGTGQIGTHFTFKTSMRATPTMSNYTAGSVDNSTSLDAFYGASTEGCGVSINCGAGNVYAFGVSAIASVEL